MSKAYAKTRAEEKKKSSSASSQKKDKFQQAYEQGTEIYNQNRQNTIQEVRRLQQSLDATSGIAGKTETTARTYLDNLAAYRARLASLGMYGANVGRAYSQAGKTAEEVRSWLPALQQQDRERARQREIQAARNRRPWAERVGLVDPNEAEMTFGVYNPSASERGRLSNVAAAGGRGWLAGQANALGFALDPDQPDEAEMFFGKAPTSKLGEKISEKINQGLFNESQRLYGAADRLNAQAQENEAAAREGLGKVGNVLVDAGIAGTQMLLDASIGRATGTGMTSMGTRTFGQSAREALDSGASYQQAMDYGALSAAVEVGTEKMFDVGKVFGKGAGDELIEAWIAKHGKTAAGTTILRMLAGMGSEGLEEVVSSAVNPILRSGFDPDALKDYRTREYWADMLNEGLVGALLGGVGVAGNVITGGNARMKAEVEQRALNQRLERADAFNKAQREFFAGNTMQTGTADAEAQRVLNRNSGTVGESDKAAVRTAARQQYGAQARAVESVYESGTADAETFLRQFETAYNLGREGANIETAMNTPATAGLNEQQRRNAWLIGRDVGVRAGDITEDTSGTPGSSSPTEIGGAQNNGEAIRVRGSSERDAGASSLGSVQQVESGTGSYQEGRSIGIGESSADSAAQTLRYSSEVKSARELGIENGAVIQNLRTVDETSYTPEMKEYADEQAEKGHRVVYLSGMIHAQDAPGGMVTRSRGMVNTNGDIFVQVDHPRFTAMQIARHEDAHTRIQRGEIDLQKAKDAVQQSLGEEEYKRAVYDYASAYAGIDMTDDEAFEEIVCDAEGGMNIFEGAALKKEYERNARITEAARKAVRESAGERKADGTRAPPEEKTKFSMEAPIEETRDLIAVHNLTYDNLRRAAKLGGIPMPSIAVIKGKNGFNQYGPMSFVFRKDTIDPKKDRRNRIYGADAWTPTAANARVEYQIDSGKSLKFERKIDELAKKVAGGIFSNTNVVRQRGVDDDTTMTASEMAERLSEDSAVRAAYLADKGQNIEPVMRDVEYDSRGNEYLQMVIDRFGLKRLEQFAHDMENGNWISGEDLERMREIEYQFQYDRLKPFAKLRGEDAVRNKAREFTDKKTDSQFMNFLYHAWEMHQGGKAKSEVDKIATDDALKQKAPQKDVIAWLLPQIEEFYGEPGIYNGADPYTRSGERKTFQQLHWDYTLDNIVKAMVKTAPQRGAGLWGATPTGLQSVAAPEYRSIAEVKADSGRLARLSEEEYKSRLQEVEAEISYAIEAFLKDNPSYGGADSFGAVDSAGSALIQIASKLPKNAADVKRFAAAHGDDVTGNTAQRIYDVIQLAANLPTDYFEAKPQRAVGFEEVAQAIIPANAPADIKNILNDLGVPVSEYEYNNDEDRTEKMNAVEGAKFSRELDDEYLTAVRSGDTEKAQRMVDEAAKAAGYDSPKLYHGTNAFGFTVIDTRKSNDRISFFATDSAGTAGTYSGTSTAREIGTGGDSTLGIYQLYANTDGMLELDAGGEESGHIALGSSARDYNDTMNTKSWNSYATAKQIAKYAKRHGYIGVIIRNVIDSATPESRKALPQSNVYVFFNPQAQVKSADPVTYDDNGNIIPLSKRFNSEQADIRYSHEDNLSELRQENRELKRETDALAKAVQKWKRETKRTERYSAREEDVRRSAKDLIKTLNSTADAAEVTADMKALAEYIMNGENSEAASWLTVREMADRIADKVVGAEQVNIRGDVFNEYKRLTEILKGKTLHIDPEAVPDLQGYENLLEFNRANMGTMRLSAKEMKPGDKSVQDAYYEMIEAMPGWFPEDASTDAERVANMLEVLDGLRPVYGMSDETSYHYDEAVTWAANDIIDRVLDESIRQMPKTFADRAQAKLDKERARLYQRIRDVRAQGNERVERTKREYAERSRRAIERMQARQEKQIADLKAKQRAKEKNARERREENAGIRKYRERVERTVKTLTDWLQTNSDKEHVPEGIKKPLAEFLSTIDFTSKRALRGGEQTAKDQKYLSRMEALQEILTRQLNYQDGLSRNAEDVLGGYLDITPEYMEQMQAHIDAVKAILGGEADVETGVINRMSAAELQDLDHLLTTLKRAIQGINKLTENARYQSVIEAAKSTMDELGQIREDGGETGKLRSFFMWDNTTPFYAFKRFGTAASSVFEALQNGWDKFAFNVKEIMEFTRETYSTKQVREWARRTQEFTLENGETVTMTPAQIMTLYEVMKQEDAVRHAQGGGVRIGNIERRGKKTIQQTAHHHFSERDLQQIFGALTDEQKRVADKLQKYMQDRGSEWGNEVSMKRYGYKAFGVDHYFPIQTEDRVRDIKTPGEEGNDLYRLLNISATKGRLSNANNALIVRDIFDVFADHMTDMAKYNSLALPILDATKWINYRERTDVSEGGFETQTVQRSIERAFGENALRYYTTFMKDLNGKHESTGRGEDLPRKMISNYKVAAVGANLRVVLLQPTAYVRAIYALNGRQLAVAPFIPGALKEMDKYSGIAAWKSLGYYDTNIARGVREQIKDAGGFKEKLQEASMKGAELGDRLTWGALWNACKLDVKARNKGLDGEALMQATAEKFREVVYSTQVVDSTMTRSHNMRATSLFGSMATAFMAEPTLSYNLVLDAYSDYSKTARSTNKSEAWKKTRGKMAKAFTVYTVSALASAIVESIADAFRDDDEYETFMDKFMEALLGEPGFKGRLNSNLVNDLLIFNKLPIIKDAISILSGYGADRLDVEWISNALKAYSAIAEKIQLANGDLEKPTKTTYFGKMTWYGAVFLGLKTLSQATGLPVSGLTREAITIWNSTAGQITGDKVKTYDASAKSQIQKGLENGYLSEDRAAELLVREGEAKDADKAYWMVQEMLTGNKKYDAIMEAAVSGDKKAFNAALQELKKHGVSEKDAISNVKSAVGKMYKGSEDEEPSISRDQAIRMLTDYAGMKKEDAEKAVDKWTLKRDTGYDLSDMRSAFVEGDVSESELRNALTKYGGKTDEEAEKAVRELEVQKEFGIEYGVQNVQEAVAAGELSEADARTIWTEYGGKSEEDADELIAAANFKAAHSDVDLDDVTASRIQIYEQYAPDGTDAAEFMSYAAQIRKDQNAGKYPGIPDGKGGKKPYSVMDAVAEWINSLPISDGEKTALLLTYTNGKTTSLSRYRWS